MTNDKVRIFENKMLGGFEVEYDGIAVAQFSTAQSGTNGAS